MSADIGVVSGKVRPKRWQVPPVPRPPDGLTYQDLRKQIQTGDLLLFRGTKFLSGVIERLSDSPYSHVAILANWNDRVVAFQADLRGVEILPASKMVCKYAGKVDWWALKPEYRNNPEFNPQTLLDTALTLVGIKYGYLKLIGLGLRILFGRALNPKDAHATPDSLFCSQFVSQCYRKGVGKDFDVNPEVNDASTSPSDFAKSKFFEPRYRLFDGSGGKACEGLLWESLSAEEGEEGGTGGKPKRGKRKRVATWDGERRLNGTPPG